MTAADLLRGGGLDPAAVASELVYVDPEQVPVRKAPRLVRALWPAGIAAMTVPWVIWIDPAMLGWEPERQARLIVHELAHSAQWKRLGWVGFSFAYLRDYLRRRLRGMSHQEAYRANRFEVEANELRDRVVGL